MKMRGKKEQGRDQAYLCCSVTCSELNSICLHMMVRCIVGSSWSNLLNSNETLLLCMDRPNVARFEAESPPLGSHSL